MDSINSKLGDAIYSLRKLADDFEFVRNGRALILKQVGNNSGFKLRNINDVLLQIAKEEADFRRKAIDESCRAAFETEQR